jgi:hypothetical protein
MNFRDIKNIKELLKQAEQQYKIFVDQDQVLADFNKHFESFGHGGPEEFEAKHGEQAFWNFLKNSDPHFFLNLEWMPDGRELWNALKKYNPTILTKPALIPHCKEDKLKWVKKEIGNASVIVATKKEQYAAPNAILIDDLKTNIKKWEVAGGIGILHTDARSTLNKLKKLLKE